MNSIIYVDSQIPNYSLFVTGIQVPIGNFINPELANINRIGFVWENNKKTIPFGTKKYNYIKPNNPGYNYLTHYFTEELVGYLKQFSTNITVDLITCFLNTPTFYDELQIIQTILPNVTFNYSINQTGNPVQSDWIMESSGENISQVYFNSNIINYTGILAVPNANTLGANFTYTETGTAGVDLVQTFTLNTDFTIDDVTGWTSIDITHSSLTDKIVIDGSSHIITVKITEFNGMFLAGNSLTDTYATEFANMVFFVPPNTATYINTLLMKTDNYVKINNCKAKVNADINGSGGIFGFYNTQPVKKITLTNSYAITIGNIGIYSGSLIGYLGMGGNVTIDCCFAIVNGNLAEGAGGFVGGGLGYGPGHLLSISNCFIVYNGSLLSIYSGILLGHLCGGNSGSITFANNIIIANIGNIDSNGLFVGLKNVGGLSTPTVLPGVKNYILDLTGTKTNTISDFTAVKSVWTKHVEYSVFISDVNANLRQQTDKFSTDNFGIIYNQIQLIFPQLIGLDYYSVIISDPATFIVSTKLLSILAEFTIGNQTYSLTPFLPTLPTIQVGDGTIEYTSSNNLVATVNSLTGQIIMVSAGIVTIRATLSETTQYLPSFQSSTFTIEKASSTLANFTIGNQTYSPTPFIPDLPAIQAGNGTISYSSSDNLIATINSSSGQITMIKPGSVTITATLSETDQYLSTTQSTTFLILKPPEAPVQPIETKKPLQTGGDPIICPLVGPKYALAPHIKFVNLLADYSNGIFVNAQVDMLKQTDFPKQIYWDNSFSQTKDLTHIYSNSYYRKFHITWNSESIEIDADTLMVTKLTGLNKLRVGKFTPKLGLPSVSFDKTYPLLNSTIGLKVGLGNYLLTLITDINTDDRHNLNLLNVKPYDLSKVSGALISSDNIIRISDLAGAELYQYDSNPFCEQTLKL